MTQLHVSFRALPPQGLRGMTIWPAIGALRLTLGIADFLGDNHKLLKFGALMGQLGLDRAEYGLAWEHYTSGELDTAAALTICDRWTPEGQALSDRTRMAMDEFRGPPPCDADLLPLELEEDMLVSNLLPSLAALGFTAISLPAFYAYLDRHAYRRYAGQIVGLVGNVIQPELLIAGRRDGDAGYGGRRNVRSVAPVEAGNICLHARDVVLVSH